MVALSPPGLAMLPPPPPPRTHHASFRGEDNYLVEGCKLLQEALDARALLEAPASDELVSGVGQDREVSQGGGGWGGAWEGLGDTHRPLGVQQDVSELNDEGVGGLVVRFAQGVRQQLGAGGLDDHLGRVTGRDGVPPPAWG